MPSESMEDYLKAIYIIQQTQEFARTGDVGQMLGHKSSSVTEMFQKMADRGYIIYRKYEGAQLTDEGLKEAEAIVERHAVLRDFLKILGVGEEIAEEDACGIEHHLHEETLKRLTKFVEFVRDSPRNPRWLEHFREYYESNKRPECKD